ncbi:trypsin-like peptidase domain-containing protein [Myroides sp. DW712]|uniref:trypsin-like peptidase domain-containing protein n=1 Tax=Myroides sp. DW712 TaxID=3389800 RepID=UPI00397C15FC
MKKFFTTFFTCLLTAGLTLVGYTYYLEKQIATKKEPQQTEFTTSHQRWSTANPVDFTTAAEKTVNAVVHVKNLSYITTRTNPLLEFFYGYKGGTQAQVGTGSGVIISEDGYIVTNNHVIANASELEITLNNNQTYKAQLIGTEKQMDLALLKINTTEKLPFLTFGDSDAIQLGEWVLAVGNPYNLTSTVTAGIISAKARNLSETGIQSFIQTDAAVNPGNSGGALVNAQGELIGINTMISSNTGSYVGYAFAVPSNVTKKIVEDFLEFGNVQQGALGVSGFELNSNWAQKLNLDSSQGFYIQEVVKNSDAAHVNLKKGDIITAINGRPITSFVDIKNILNTKRPGDKVQLTINSNNSIQQKEIRLIAASVSSFDFNGLTFEDVSPEERTRYKIKYGVKITAISNEKFLPYQGELIHAILLAVNGQKITTINQAKELFSQFQESQRLKLDILSPKGELIKVYL